MVRRFKWQIVLGTSLVIVSAGLFLVQIAIFRDARNTFFYLFQDIAFIPIQVLLVTLILNQLLNVREKLSMLNKMNMVIGTFYSEVGNALLRRFVGLDRSAEKLRQVLLVNGEWTDRQFAASAKSAAGTDFQISPAAADLMSLKALLNGKRDFLLRLLENPNLLEHETFTDLLWAVFHLTEELAVREDLSQLAAADGNHIAGDIKRAYALLITEWLAYMRHLKSDYPYLFSLAARMNPFDPNASAVVK